MLKAILFADPFVNMNPSWGAKFGVEPYPSEDNNFDPRIGWYTQIVTVNLYYENEMNPVGFLSEPFK
jgi:hypothetical protein